METKDKKSKIGIGKFGEDLACGYLAERGYKILRRNERSKFGELDMVVKSRDQTLVFVEVKAMSGIGIEEASPSTSLGLVPEDQMTTAKLGKFKRAAEMFAAANPDLIDEKKGWRMDLVAIDLSANGKPRLRHYENI